MKLATTYICVKDMQRSLNFYKQLLQQEPLYMNDDRWAEFDCGNQLALYNEKYDIELIKEKKAAIQFNQAYLHQLCSKENKQNNCMILNFVVQDLKKEYKRIQQLQIGEMSEIMYINIFHPYYYFNVLDPDGNVIEITGQYTL